MDYLEAELEARIFPSVDLDPRDWEEHYMTDEELDEAFCTSVGEMDFSIVNVEDVQRWMWHSITFHQLDMTEEEFNSRFNSITKDVAWVNVQHMKWGKA